MTDTSKRNNDAIAIACVLSAQMSPEDKERCITLIRNVLDQRERERDEAVREERERIVKIILQKSVPSKDCFNIVVVPKFPLIEALTTPQEAPEEGTPNTTHHDNK